MPKRKKKIRRIPVAWKRKKRKLMIFFVLVFSVVVVVGFFAIRNNWFALGSDEAKKVIPQFYNQSLEVSVGSKKLTVTPMAGNPVKVVQKDVRYVYEEAYENTDVVQSVYPYKIKEELIFYGTGHPLEFKYKLGNIDKFIVEKDEKGNIKFYDKQTYEESGELSKIFTIPTPFVEDKVGERSFIDVESIIDEDVLIITINPDWINQAVYPVILDPTIEINVLNVYSHPSLGENWEVEFTTKGKADLKIIPQDQATIDDDEFIGLYCDQNIHEPVILTGDVIYYQNWECSGIGKVIHKTLKAGHHTLKFEFSGVEGYAEDWAYNAPVSWYDSSWSYRIKLTVQNGKVDADLTNFPVLVNLDDLPDDTFWVHVKSACADIRITQTNGITELPREIVACDTSAKTGEMHFKGDALANLTDTDFYIYYGNSGASEPAANSTYGSQKVWNEGENNYYKGVQHFEESSGTLSDSTSNGMNATVGGSPTYAATGPGYTGTGFGYTAEGTSNMIYTGSAFDTNANDWTVEFWANYTQIADYQTIVWHQAQSGGGWTELFTVSADSSIMVWWNGGPSAGDTGIDMVWGSWHHWVFRYDDTAFKTYIYKDGVLQNSGGYSGDLGNSINTAKWAHFTRWDASTQGGRGTIDEWRFSTMARAAEWISTEYNNQNSPSTFYSLETEQAQSIINIKGGTRIRGGTRLNLEDTQQKL